METIISAAITGVIAIIVCMINNSFQSQRAEKQHHATIALIEYRLDELKKKVELHNNAVERLYKAEKAIELHDERIRVANHRLNDLEHEKAGG